MALTKHLRTRHLRRSSSLLDILSAFVVELSALLEKLKLSATQPRIDLLQGLFVGLSIIDLATGRKNGRARAKAALNLAFDLLSGDKA